MEETIKPIKKTSNTFSPYKRALQKKNTITGN